MRTIKRNAGRDSSITVNDSGAGARVSLSGRLSIDTSPQVRDRLLAILGQKLISAAIIDMAELSHPDCAGIATVTESLRIAGSRDTAPRFADLADGYFADATELLNLFKQATAAAPLLQRSRADKSHRRR
jgi:anti-anti-sigma regulatory factor